MYTRKPCCAEKPHCAVVKFNAYRNLQRHRTVLPAIARLLLLIGVYCMSNIKILYPKTKFWLHPVTPVINNSAKSCCDLHFAVACMAEVTNILQTNQCIVLCRPYNRLQTSAYRLHILEHWQIWHEWANLQRLYQSGHGHGLAKVTHPFAIMAVLLLSHFDLSSDEIKFYDESN